MNILFIMKQHGELTCKKDGWYGFDMRIRLHYGIINQKWTNLILSLEINNCLISRNRATAQASSCLSDNSNFVSLYLKKEDKIKIEKKEEVDAPEIISEAYLNIFKL